MADFDPSKPIDDPQVWFPKGMFIDNKAQQLTINVHAADEDDKTFILNHDKMVAFSRFLWTGKLLPTSRDAYVKTLGLTTTEEITDQISKDCTQFKEVTWDKLVDLSGQIKTYATMAGGTSSSSYYQGMLEWDHIKEALAALSTFHDNCKGYESTLGDDGKTLQALLEKEGNDVEHLTSEINKELKEIEDLRTHIDRVEVFLQLPRNIPILSEHVLADFQKIEESIFYVLVNKSLPCNSPFVGAIVSATVTFMAKADIDRLKAAMKGIQALLDANKEKLQTAYRLQGDISSMGPAIATLEALQGAWAEINTDLQTLYDLFEDDKQSIPPMLLEKRQLEAIVGAWNDLKAYASDYIEHAFMTNDPEQITIQEYVKQLDNAVD
ncbi:hypothetical protein CFAM422_000390 [Trichoderma lentiforme]|uniref:Uncharacterized protein n=1 Tax=Trichoderma lentiforme TaxID=1567552 RepID=A0A9P4XMU2_9HYPO|nr:hypothetical protein CFAM422_000390 [Trichoderma lentiforme]